MSISNFIRDREGAVAVEFALLFVALFVITVGIIDVGAALYQWNRAEKALQQAARYAVVSDPVANDLRFFSGKTAGNTFGDSCRDSATGGIQAYCQYGPIVCTNTECSSYGFSATAFDAIFQKVQAVIPSVTPENLAVEYRATELAFVGRPGGRTGEFNLVPVVTIRLRNIAYNFMVLDDLFGIGPVLMPGFTTTLVGEDVGTVTDP